MKYALIAAGLALLAPGAAFAQADEVPAAAVGHFTLDTPIKDLIADPAAKAVLDKDLPGMSSDENLPKFEDKSLRELQPLTGGQLTDALLKRVAGDLAAIGGDDAATADAPASEDAAPPADDASPPNDAATTDDAAGSASAPVGR